MIVLISFGVSAALIVFAKREVAQEHKRQQRCREFMELHSKHGWWG